MDYFANPQLINFEVTQRCSFECPQCYCQKDTERFGLFYSKSCNKRVCKNGVKYVNISVENIALSSSHRSIRTLFCA